jgi:hypothetical protein
MEKLNLTISELILNNERLTRALRTYIEEVNRLERFRLLLREKPMEDSQINLKLLQDLNRKINKAVEMFRERIRIFEGELQRGPYTDEDTDVYISEITEHCKDIEDIFMRTNITSLNR